MASTPSQRYPFKVERKLLIILALILCVLILCVLVASLVYLVWQEFVAAPRPTSTPSVNLLTPSGETVWDRIQATKKIVAGVSADYPPFAYVGADFSLQGYDIALANEIGRRLNLQIEFKNMAFDGLSAALQLNQIDMAIAAISVTPERQAAVDFTNIYYVGEDAVIVNQAAPFQVTRAEDLAGRRVGVQRGSVYETWLQNSLILLGLMPPQNMALYDSTDGAIAALAGPAPQIEAVVMDFLPAQKAIQGKPLQIIARGLNPQGFAIAIPKGAQDFLNILNITLGEMQKDGTLVMLAQQYLKIEQPAPPPTPTPTQPAPTAPPPPPPACLDGMSFVADLNYPDNNMLNPPQVPPGVPVQKGWRIRNTGTCTWDNSYVMTYVGANPPNSPVSGNPVAIQGYVAPGQTYDLYVTLTTPWQTGRYQSFWSLRNGKGQYFGNRLWMGMQVIGQVTPTSGPDKPVIYNFSANPMQLQGGDCLTLNWSFGGQNLLMTRIFRNNYLILQDLSPTGSGRDCPPDTGNTEYRLTVDSWFNGSTSASQTVFVYPPLLPTPSPWPTQPQPPVINFFSANPNPIDQGQCLNLSWSFSGDNITSAAIYRDGDSIADGLAPNGIMQDCPPDSGQVEYRLMVISAFGGGANASQFVFVQPLLQITPDDQP
ncbi:MAG: transporter substrate-binding domain-containing protein [Anaerolineales bacterium]|nr:transporter substrate-binding domain-containing protein [Anaerolineales bacterium]